MKLKVVERKAFDILASSIIRGFEIKRWLYSEREIGVELPFYTETSPEQVHYFKTEVEVPTSRYSWLLKFVLSGNALLKLNGESYTGIDEAHTYTVIPQGKHLIELLITPRSLFGVHGWRFVFDNAYLVEVNLKAFNIGLYVLGLTKLVESTLLRDDFRRDLGEVLYKTLLDVRVNPSLKQVALLHILLYEPRWEASRQEIPRERWDYSWLAYTYGIGALKGYVEDLKATSIEEISETAEEVLKRIEEGLEKLTNRYPKQGTIYLVGHSHIDAAWLWPVDETVRKVLRTFSTVTRLAEEYDFTYVQSSAQYYEWVEREDRQLFEKIKKLVELGKWIIAGGMWVEGDTYIVEGESLARQFLYGQRYFYEKFGKIARIGWLPDSFGFSGNLPQIMRKSGIEVFVTHKVMWNDTNEFPYHSFVWRGIDGTEIPVQVLPTSYNEVITPVSIYNYWLKYKNKNEAPFIVFSYGYGDGGGGPTREMLEYTKLLNKVPGLPFVENINEKSYIERIKAIKSRLPIWSGELYLEFHRGTYTTNIAIKNAVAEAEIALVVAETLLAITSVVKKTQVSRVVLDDLWKKLLLNQFHDIVPGSAIKEVYDIALKDLEYVVKSSSKLADALVSELVKPGEEKCTLVVLNTLPWTTSFVEKIPKVYGVPKGVECQEDVEGYYVRLEAKPTGLASYEFANTPCMASTGVKVAKIDSGYLVENGHLKMVIDNAGDIASLILKEGDIELLREPAKLLVHIDKPGLFDAWDVTDEFLYQGEPMNIVEKPSILVEGSLVSCIRLVKGFEESTVEQVICVYKDKPVVEIKNKLKWLSKNVLLKHWFKTTINATKAHFDTPFGVIERSTKFETSWEKAMFEVPALRWVDVSDGEKGLAIIAPSRHGYSVVKGDVSISLLRSPVFPNPWSDVGEFTFTYHLYPHIGDYYTAEIPRISRELIYRPMVRIVRGSTEDLTLLSINPARAILTAFKPAYDGKGYILRIYNPYNKRVSVELSLGFTVKRAVETDIIELETLTLLGENTRNLSMHLEPFEIKTIRLETE